MKKFAWMFAALTLCAGAFTACGDDSDDDSKKKNGEACAKADECESGVCTDSKCAAQSSSSDKKENGADCSKADECKSGVCDGGKCAAQSSSSDKKEDGADCSKADECKSGACDGGKCVAEPADSGACSKDTDCKESAKAVCDVASHTCVECTSESAAACELATAAGPVCINNACAKCTEDAQCGSGKVCDKASGTCGLEDGACFDDTDCKDPAKPHCGSNYTCEAAPAAKDPCEGVNCSAGECILGICVTDAMKSAKADSDYPAGAADAYCNNGSLFYKNRQGKVSIVDCKANGYSDCVVFEEVKSEGSLTADCSGQADALKACADAAQAGLDAWRVETCLTSTELYQVWCTKDTSGNAIAVPTYERETDGECEGGKACVIEAAGPVCK